MWATFNSWRARGRTVAEGEKSKCRDDYGRALFHFDQTVEPNEEFRRNYIRNNDHYVRPPRSKKVTEALQAYREAKRNLFNRSFQLDVGINEEVPRQPTPEGFVIVRDLLPKVQGVSLKINGTMVYLKYAPDVVFY